MRRRPVRWWAAGALFLAAVGIGTLVLRPRPGGGEIPRPLPPLPAADPGVAAPDPLAGGDDRYAVERAGYRERIVEGIRRHRAAAGSAGRVEALRELGPAHQLFVRMGGGPDFLPFLEEVVRKGETAEERQAAVIAVHSTSLPACVDFLVRFTEDADPGVRFYAVEGLAWVRGAEAERATARLVEGMDDADGKVREIAALSLAVVVADPLMVPAILERLRTERERGAAAAMVTAALRLDPVGGKMRIARAMEEAPEEVRRLVGSVLAGRKEGR